MSLNSSPLHKNDSSQSQHQNCHQIHTPPLHQPLLNPSTVKEPWGETIDMNPSTHTLWVLSNNMNMLSSSDNFLDWQAVVQTFVEYTVNVACLLETNIQCLPPILDCICQIFHNLPTWHTKLASLNSKDVTTDNYQPGGTCTIVLRL